MSLRTQANTCACWLRHGAAAMLCLAAALLHTPAQAQVWGYVNALGVAHFSADKLDDRYELFYRGDTVAATPDSSGWETPALIGTGFPETGAVVAPARLLAFFQVSPTYKAVRHHIRDAARVHGVPPELLQAVIAAESGFDARAISPRGAVGLMQIMPTTAQAHGLRVHPQRSLESQLVDPRTNIQTGAKILARLLGRFPQQVDLALAAYNAGEGAVRRAGKQVPNFPETRQYVRTVTQLYQFLQPPLGLQRRAAQAAADQHALAQP